MKVIGRTSTGLGNINTLSHMAPESSATGYIFPRRAGGKVRSGTGLWDLRVAGERRLVVKASRVSEKKSRTVSSLGHVKNPHNITELGSSWMSQNDPIQ